MPSQQDIKRRIGSVQNTRKITKAMELVAGAKLRRAQARVEAMRPYADRTRELMIEAATRANPRGQALLARREVETVGLVVLTSDRGLAGASNTQVVRLAVSMAREHEREGRSVRWFAVGRKGIGTLRFRRFEVTDHWEGMTDRPEYRDAAAIASTIAHRYREQELDLVQLVHNSFESALVQTATSVDLLPVPEGELADLDPRERALRGTMLFEPEPEVMLDQLLVTALETAIYRGLLESAASKHGAQMTAMGNASKNAEEVIGNLTLAMNRARQAEITQEILEVVAGADALG